MKKYDSLVTGYYHYSIVSYTYNIIGMRICITLCPLLLVLWQLVRGTALEVDWKYVGGYLFSSSLNYIPLYIVCVAKRIITSIYV